MASKKVTPKNSPAFTLRDGAVKVTAWANSAKESQKIFHSVQVSRSYKVGDDWKETTQFSGSDILKVSALLQQAHAKIRELETAAA